MKFKLLTLLLFISISSFGQWTSRASFPGVARAKSVSFTIADKIYVLGGITNANVVLNDFWEYDIIANTWTQKPVFPGPERYGAVSFVLGGTGYIATGGNDNGYLDDMWQYDPVNSQWTQRIGLPAGSAQHENQRAEAFGFVINNKAYLGGGNGWVFGANSTNNIAFADLWEYDPSSNTWTTKSGFPDFIGRNMSVAGAINGLGYVGLGCNVDQNLNYQTMWAYDPATDSWTAKAIFPTNFTADAASFVLGTNMYIVGGVNMNPVGLSNQVYEYDATTDTWTQLTAYSGNAVAGPFCSSTGTRAFVGGGYNGSIVPRNDVWEFAQSSTGVSSMNKNNEVVVYPNPANEFITLKTSSQIESIEAFDVNGKKIFSYLNKQDQIDISNIPNGIYELTYHTKDGHLGKERFIK